ncbi:MAG TPA: AI-2E family transporter, partial [Polyangiaceae bacterium]|nr:AI-2E family transporter [Polyangiaceae bacterium]
MSHPESVREPLSSRASGWTRTRIVFLSVSALVTLAVLIWAREVLLPFVLALIIAYVLTPLVVLCERARLPRPAAILLVYFATFGILYLSIAAVAPRIYVEAQKLAGDAPNLARELSNKWGPRLEHWVQGLIDRTRGPAAIPAEPPPPPPGIEIVRRPDGSLQVDLGAGLDIVQQGPGHWRVGTAVSRPSTKFSVAELSEEGIQEAVSYLKRNALGVVRLGHAVIRQVARSIFLLFTTLMLAAYLMLTRETIIGFFRSLVPPLSRIGFDRLLLRTDRGLSGVVRGQLFICMINGVLSAIGFWMFDLKYWPILAIVAAVMSIVPIFGSIMSSVPVVLIGLTQ